MAADGTVLYTHDASAASTDVPLYFETGDHSGATNLHTGIGPYRFVGTAPFYIVAQEGGDDDETVLFGARQDKLAERAGSLKALARSVTQLKAQTDSTAATLVSDYLTETETNSAISSAVNTLATTVNGNTAAISTQATSINGLEAQYTVKIDNNGYVSGFGLASTTAVDGTPFSEFIVRADRFSIGSGNTDIIPFVVTTTTTTLNGETVPAGVYIDQAYIKNGAISEAKIGTLSADKITTGTLDADRIGASTITATKLAADSVTAEKLAISSATDGTASSIYMDSNGAIKVYDAAGTLRVKIGNLSA